MAGEGRKKETFFLCLVTSSDRFARLQARELKGSQCHICLFRWFFVSLTFRLPSILCAARGEGGELPNEIEDKWKFSLFLVAPSRRRPSGIKKYK